jgi:murein L,D-transpeptidase YcbB/YkuD
MIKFLAGVALTVLTAAAPLPALAQDVASLELRRVVIAPPQNSLATTIKEGLASAYSGTRPGTAAHEEARRLYYFYGERYFEPLWLTLAADGSLAFSDKAEAIIDVFRQAESEGLRREDYLTPDLDVSAAEGDPARMAALETAFSAAALRYATHIYNGRIRPQDVSAFLDIAPKRLDESALLMRLASSGDPGAVFAELEPRHPEFLALKAALARFESDKVDRPEPLPDGPTIKPGMSDPRVPLLRERLKITASAEALTVYDQPLADAVKAFQQAQGLEADGVVGPATLAAFNGGGPVTRADIIANMERWRWMPRELGDFNVMVNVPEYRLSINDHGKQTYATRVVVGTVKNQTPIFSDNIRHIVVNPYWNVPNSIIANEVAPAVLRNPGYISGQNMELLYNGSVISAASVNWGMVSPNNFPFRVRQKPGPGNALGQIKFLFPNKHDVYLHDTPSKSLFARGFRAYSHGCIRVENPMEFADALTVNEPSIDRASLEALFGPSERWVNPQKQIPVHIAYFTLRVFEDGTLRSFGDVYGHNEKLIELMGL